MISALDRKEIRIVIAFMAVKLLLHFFTSTNYDLHRDTFLYYALGQNLAWGYASVPPLIGILSGASTFLFGHNAFALNLFPAIAGSISLLLIALIVKSLGGKTFALITAMLAFLLSPAYLRSNSLMQPVSFDQFFWLLSAYFVVKLVQEENPVYWVHILLAWGVGFLNKYLIAGYAVAFMVALIFSRYRKLIISRYFVYGAVLSLLLVLPHLLWQYQHNWPALHHLSELSRSQLVNVSFAGFIADQIMMNFPVLIVWGTGLIVFLTFRAERKLALLSVASLLVILLLLLLHGKSYYTLGAYTLLFAMGGYAIEKYYSSRMKKVIVVLTVVLSLPLMPYSLPVLSLPAMEKFSAPLAQATNRWEDGKVYPLPQDYADMTGWKELSRIVISTYNQLPESVKSNCSVYCENYGQAGAVLFYGKDYHIPQPISFSDNFLFWAPDSIFTDNLIYVNHEEGDIRFLFRNVELKGEVKNHYFRENGLKVYFCSEPTDTFSRFYAQKVNELKSMFKN